MEKWAVRVDGMIKQFRGSTPIMVLIPQLDRYAEVIARHTDSPAKRELVSEYLEGLQRRGGLTARERSRLTATLLGSPDR
jgi:hypothetical protein